MADETEDIEFTKEQKHAYVEKIIAKQTGLDADDAKALASKLKSSQFDELHDAGRAGNPAACCEIICECCGDDKDVLAAIKANYPAVVAAHKAKKHKPKPTPAHA